MVELVCSTAIPGRKIATLLTLDVFSRRAHVPTHHCKKKKKKLVVDKMVPFLICYHIMWKTVTKFNFITLNGTGAHSPYSRHKLSENIKAFLSESWVVRIASSQIGNNSLVLVQLTELFHFFLQVISTL